MMDARRGLFLSFWIQRRSIDLAAGSSASIAPMRSFNEWMDLL